jgi:hypothetical protein
LKDLKKYYRDRFHQTFFAKRKVAGAHFLAKNSELFSRTMFAVCQSCAPFDKPRAPKKLLKLCKKKLEEYVGDNDPGICYS